MVLLVVGVVPDSGTDVQTILKIRESFLGGFDERMVIRQVESVRVPEHDFFDGIGGACR